VYWQGRWIPWASTGAVDLFRPERGAFDPELLGRLRGTIFLPRAMLPSNTKLNLQEALERLMAAEGARVFMDGWAGEETPAREFRKRFGDWISRCHRDYDRDIEFREREGPCEGGAATAFGSIRYGRREYRRGERVRFKRRGAAGMVCGEIHAFECDGDCADGFRAPDGRFVYRRHPAKVFGDRLAREPVASLAGKARSEAAAKAEERQWEKEVERIRREAPARLAVQWGLAAEEAIELRPGAADQPRQGAAAVIASPSPAARTRAGVRASPGPTASPASPAVAAGGAVPATIVLPAAARLPPLSVFILPERGQPVSEMPSADGPGRALLSVRRRVQKLEDHGADGTKAPDGVLLDDSTQTRPDAGKCFQFDFLDGAFDGAGRYRLTLQAMGHEALSRGRVQWVADVLVVAGAPREAQVRAAAADQVVRARLGEPVAGGALMVCLRDGLREVVRCAMGNVCFADGRELPAGAAITVRGRPAALGVLGGGWPAGRLIRHVRKAAAGPGPAGELINPDA
jgi:hypothetical protein